MSTAEPLPLIPPGDAVHAEDESDVFVCRHVEAKPEAVVDPAVTLHVYGWHNVEPGPLSWRFDDLRSALAAVRTMKNAIRWSIVSGDHATVDEARTAGAVLIEQLG